MASRVKKVLSLFAAIVMCAALCPAVAHAAQLATGTAPAADSPKTAVRTQATKPVYVITKITKTTEYAGSQTITERKLAYNKSKLVKSCGGWYWKWSYGKNNGVKSVKQGTGEYEYTYDLDANGRQTVYHVWTPDSNDSYKLKYNKAGKLVSATGSSYYYEDESSYSSKTTFSYKNGLRVRDGDIRYAYDKRKNLVKYEDRFDTLAFNNAYKNGRLVKRTFTKADSESGDMSVITYKYSYKRVKVQKNLVKKVKAQQWALRNDNLNDALGHGVSVNYLIDERYDWY